MSRAMLGLCEQVSRCELRLGRVVREHQELTGTRQQIDRNITNNEAFGRDHKGIAWAEDLLHTRNGVRSISHCGNRLGTADAVKLSSACGPSGKQQRGVNGAV